MASLHIHQDLYNFEKKRHGFTQRQIRYAVLAVALACAITAALSYVGGIFPVISVTIAVMIASPVVAAGFLPLWHMPADEWADRIISLNKRGNSIVWEGPFVEPMKGVTTRAHKKQESKRGSECD